MTRLKSNKSQTELVKNETETELSAKVFLSSMDEGYTTSLGSSTLPLTLSDKILLGKIPQELAVLTVENEECIITYRAAQIKNPETGQIEHFFAAKAAGAVFAAIWELINTGKCSLEQSGDTFQITFRKIDLRKCLESMGRSRSGLQVNLQLEILQCSIIEITKKDSDEKGRIKLTGAYLQNAFDVESDDSRIDGLFTATLHPVIANDLINGRWRDIETNFYQAGESDEIYKALINLMRHLFTNADASSEKIPYQCYFSDIMFRAGRMADLTIPSTRKLIGGLKEKVLKMKLISSEDKFKSEVVYNAKTKKSDYLITITPTTEWGLSQKRSNAKLKAQKKALNLDEPSKPKLRNIGK